MHHQNDERFYERTGFRPRPHSLPQQQVNYEVISIFNSLQIIGKSVKVRATKNDCFLNNNCRAYANAVQDDLWQALQDQVVADNIQLPATVKQIMVNI